MQIYDYTPVAGQTPSQGGFKRLGLMFKYGTEWTAEMEAQRTVLDLLSKFLDDRYCLLRNLTLPDLEVPIPFILIGPPGIQMLYVTPIRGIYRARGDMWFVVDSHRRFRPAAPNLIIRSSLMARAIQVYLEKHGCPEAKVEPMLVSTSPGLYIEVIRPTVRIVMSDAVDRMLASLQGGPLVLTRPDVEKMIQLLTDRSTTEVQAVEPFVPEAVTEETPAWMADRIAALDAAPEAEPVEELESSPAADEQTAAEAHAEWAPEEIHPEPVGAEVFTLPAAVEVDAALPSPAPAPARPRSIFTRGQWLVLGTMVVLILLVLAAFVYLLQTSV
jgi:hypothetical protein